MNNTAQAPPPIVCLGCQEIDRQIKAVFVQMGNSLLHADLACRCNSCGKFLFTGRMYNPNVYVKQVHPAPHIVKGN